MCNEKEKIMKNNHQIQLWYSLYLFFFHLYRLILLLMLLKKE